MRTRAKPSKRLGANGLKGHKRCHKSSATLLENRPPGCQGHAIKWQHKRQQGSTAEDGRQATATRAMYKASDIRSLWYARKQRAMHEFTRCRGGKPPRRHKRHSHQQTNAPQATALRVYAKHPLVCRRPKRNTTQTHTHAQQLQSMSAWAPQTTMAVST